ncbi:GD24260 [Drosophila simulans]|uniref:GD24260 n=1 Tax=Drosophila simulans TaxID=7240 RepID=B4Q3D9_DROSI|nr:GD24260 [Drosophila simulans]
MCPPDASHPTSRILTSCPSRAQLSVGIAAPAASIRTQSPSSVRAVNSSIDRIELCFCSGATPAFLSGECVAEKSLSPGSLRDL